nr:unnamed protein product [Salmo salar]|eukprot:XP_013999348.1 PREDICTED: neuroglobin-like isoform X2 [Salmo salar]
MGCAISGLAPKQVGDVMDDVPIVHLTDEHREIIKETWKVIQENIAKVGIIMFVGIMHFIEKSVARLNQMERLDQLILDLGKSHYRYNSPPKYYMYVGAEFIRAVQPILKDNWTPEVEEAWKTLFLYITSIMKQGYVEEEKNQRNTMANTSRERPEKRLNVI